MRKEWWYVIVLVILILVLIVVFRGDVGLSPTRVIANEESADEEALRNNFVFDNELVTGADGIKRAEDFVNGLKLLGGDRE